MQTIPFLQFPFYSLFPNLRTGQQIPSCLSEFVCCFPHRRRCPSDMPLTCLSNESNPHPPSLSLLQHSIKLSLPSIALLHCPVLQESDLKFQKYTVESFTRHRHQNNWRFTMTREAGWLYGIISSVSYEQ